MKQKTLLSVILLIALIALAIRGASDPDLWWHLATGRLISDNLAAGESLAGAIPHQDPFSYTFAGQPWVAHEWLTDVLMYQVYSLAGLAGLMVVFAVVVGVAYWLVFIMVADENPSLAAAITLWGAVVSIPAWGPRPQMINLLFTAMVLFILWHWRNRQDYSVFSLPFVFLLWVNMHGGFAIGLGLIGLVAVFLWPVRQWVKYEWLILAGALSVGAAAANPHGLALFVYPFQTLASDVMQNNILEWFSPNFHLVDYQVFAVMVLAGLVSFVYSPVKPDVGEWVLFCGAAAAGFLSVRNIPLFALVAIVVMTPYAARCFARKPIRFIPTRLAWLILALALAGGLAHGTTVLRANRSQEIERWPVAAVDFMEAIGVDGPVFNDYQFGGYLIWRGWPVYIDGRADLYGDHLLDYLGASNARGDGYQAQINEWGIDTALVYADSPLATVLRASGSWLQVYQDDQALILLKVK